MSNNIFNIGVSGLNAAQWGLTTTGQNISNASTPGLFARKGRCIRKRPASTRTRAISATACRASPSARSYSQYLTTQLNNTQSTSSSANTYYTLMSQLNNLVGDPTTGIGAGISSYFTGMQSVANAAGTTSARQVLVSSAQSLADQINAAGSQYDQLRQSVNTQLTSAVTQINSYTQQIADAEQADQHRERAGPAAQPAPRPARPRGAEPELDGRRAGHADERQLQRVHRQRASRSWSAARNTACRRSRRRPIRANSRSRSRAPTARPRRPRRPTIMPDSALSGGTVGGLLNFRSQTLDPAQAQLGAIATSFAAQLNQQNALGIDLNGNPGGALFSAGSPTTYANVRNTGNATVGVTFADPTQPLDGRLHAFVQRLELHAVGPRERQGDRQLRRPRDERHAGRAQHHGVGRDERRRLVHDPADPRRARRLRAVEHESGGDRGGVARRSPRRRRPTRAARRFRPRR